MTAQYPEALKPVCFIQKNLGGKCSEDLKILSWFLNIEQDLPKIYQGSYFPNLNAMKMAI